MHPKRKGVQTEYEILSDLLNAGFSVSQPVGDCDSYDFIIDHCGLWKAQVKTARMCPNGSFQINATRTRTNSKTWLTTGYSPGEIDLLLTRYKSVTYFYPFCLIPGKAKVLRVTKALNGQESKVTLASEFSLDKLSAYLETNRVELRKFGEAGDAVIPSQAASRKV